MMNDFCFHYTADALGLKEACFPKGKNPVALLAKVHPGVKIVQAANAKLISIEVMALGLEKMLNIYQKVWLEDINSGAFCCSMGIFEIPTLQWQWEVTHHDFPYHRFPIVSRTHPR
jgi:hypothetical protein